MCSYNVLQLVKQITTAGVVSISQRNTVTNENNKSLCLCMVLIHNYYDMGVAMVDYVIVITCTLHVWGPLELQLFKGTQEKAEYGIAE